MFCEYMARKYFIPIVVLRYDAHPNILETSFVSAPAVPHGKVAVLAGPKRLAIYINL